MFLYGMICWRYSCRLVCASPEILCCIHSGSDRAEVSPIINKSLNLLTSWASEIFEHFLTTRQFFACMHSSSFHRGGTSFHCCLPQRPFFKLYLINLAVLLRATSPSASQKAGSVTWPGVWLGTKLPFMASAGCIASRAEITVPIKWCWKHWELQASCSLLKG